MSNIKVSVIIPSYNHSKFIKKAIDSVLEQTYKDFELIILDDCSSDNSVQIINSYKDKRIRKYFNKENAGAVEAVNQLVDLASGEYIALLNSDDYWSKDKLEKQVRYLDENPTSGACFTWADYVDERGKTIDENPNLNLELFHKNNRTQSEWLRYLFDYGNCLCHPSVMIRSKIYSKLGKYKHIFRQFPDYEFWLRLIKKYNIHIIEENLTHFRILTESGQNTSRLTEENQSIMHYEILTIKNNTLENCDNKLFLEAFDDKIINKRCLKNNKMIEYEKCMILYCSNYYTQLGRFVAYQKLGNLLMEKNARTLLKKEYDFDLNDYYSLGKKITGFVIYEQQIIEKIPEYIENSRGYRWLQKLYNNKIYLFIYNIRMKIKQILSK